MTTDPLKRALTNPACAQCQAKDEAIRAVLALASDFDANGNGAPLGDSAGNAWRKAARLLRAALAAALVPGSGHGQETGQ